MHALAHDFARVGFGLAQIVPIGQAHDSCHFSQCHPPIGIGGCRVCDYRVIPLTGKVPFFNCAYIRAIVRDEHSAEDIFQEISLLAVHKQDEINDAEHLKNWLRVAARNKALHFLRSQTDVTVQLDSDVLGLIDPHFARHDALDNLEVIEALIHCKQRLSPYAKRIIEARYRDGLTGEKLAKELGRSLSAVYQAMSRTHAALADCIKEKLAVDNA